MPQNLSSFFAAALPYLHLSFQTCSTKLRELPQIDTDQTQTPFTHVQSVTIRGLLYPRICMQIIFLPHHVKLAFQEPPDNTLGLTSKAIESAFSHSDSGANCVRFMHRFFEFTFGNGISNDARSRLKMCFSGT